jgi:hypothetical protein
MKMSSLSMPGRLGELLLVIALISFGYPARASVMTNATLSPDGRRIASLTFTDFELLSS